MLTTGLADEAKAERACAAIHTDTVGFAALQASRQGWRAPDGMVDPLAERLSAYTASPQFLEGQSYLLQGVSREPSSELRS